MTSSTSLPAPKVRGTLTGVAGILLILLWDHGSAYVAETVDGHLSAPEEGGAVHTDYHTVRHTRNWMYVTDQMMGMLLALAAACLHWGKHSYGLKLSAEIGGTKRLNAFTTAAAAAITTPLACVQWLFFYSAAPNAIGRAHFYLSLGAFAFFANVLSFYVHTITKPQLNPKIHKPLGALTAFVSAGIFEGVWQSSESVEISTVLALLFILAGQQQLLLGTAAPKQSTRRGTLLGYAPDGRPMYKLSESTFKAKTFAFAIGRVLRSVLEHADSRQIFFFLIVNVRHLPHPPHWYCYYGSLNTRCY